MQRKTWYYEKWGGRQASFYRIWSVKGEEPLLYANNLYEKKNITLSISGHAECAQSAVKMLALQKKSSNRRRKKVAWLSRSEGPTCVLGKPQLCRIMLHLGKNFGIKTAFM